MAAKGKMKNNLGPLLALELKKELACGRSRRASSPEIYGPPRSHSLSLSLVFFLVKFGWWSPWSNKWIFASPNGEWKFEDFFPTLLSSIATGPPEKPEQPSQIMEQIASLQVHSRKTATNSTRKTKSERSERTRAGGPITRVQEPYLGKR